MTGRGIVPRVATSAVTLGSPSSLAGTVARRTAGADLPLVVVADLVIPVDHPEPLAVARLAIPADHPVPLHPLPFPEVLLPAAVRGEEAAGQAVVLEALILGANSAMSLIAEWKTQTRISNIEMGVLNGTVVSVIARVTGTVTPARTRKCVNKAGAEVLI